MRHSLYNDDCCKIMKFFTLIFWVTLVNVCSGFLALAQEQDSTALYFVQITDPHLGCGPSVASTINVVKSLQALPLRFDFVALTGDVLCDNVEESVAQQGFDALRQLAVPVYMLAGNHDYVGTNMATYEKQVGGLNYVVEYDEKLLLFISSINPDYNPEDDVLAWAQATMSSHSGQPILLFHHEPFLPADYAPASLQRWQTLLTEFPVVAVFAGHLHRDALLWHDAVPEFVASCILPWDGRQPSYRLYEYKDSRVSYQTFYVTETSE